MSGLVSGMTGGVVASTDVRERIANGGFASGASWTIDGGGWTIGGGEATVVSDSLQLRQITGDLPAGPARLRFSGVNAVGAQVNAIAVDSGGSSISTLIAVEDAGSYSVDQAVTLPADTAGLAFVEVNGPTGSTVDNVSLIC